MTSYVVGAAAVTGLGVGWRGLGQMLVEGRRILPEAPSSFDGDSTDPRTRKLMSRSAHLAAIAAREALAEAGWAERRAEVGYYLAVGGSSGDMHEILPLLRVAIGEGELSLQRLGTEGLAVCPPLLSFQLLNNFTLCHGAIGEGLGGPNAAFFSRGGGTVVALSEALHSLQEADCDRVLVGGADCGVHPVTRSEIARGQPVRPDIVPAEAAALLALSTDPAGALAEIEGCALTGGAHRPLGEALDEALAPFAGPSALAPERPLAGPRQRAGEVVILVCAGQSEALVSLVAERRGPAPILDGARCLGEALAAGPALGWVAGLDLLASAACRRVLVFSRGADGDLGLVVLRAARAARW